ncbi:YbaB/EbfC family nucleoid-associated protein [Flindersiella endophytica]
MSQDFSFLDLSRTSDEVRQDQEQRLAKIREIQEATVSAVGQAASEDERIKVSFTEAEGVQKIELDPRALRLPSDELATEIARLVNDARKDAQQQIQRLMQDSAQDTAVDPQEFLQKMPEIERSIGDLMQETQTMTTQLMDMVERMRINGESMTSTRRPDDERDR